MAPNVDPLTIAVVFDDAGAPTLVAAPRRPPDGNATRKVRHWEYVAGVEIVVDRLESHGYARAR